MKMEQQPKTKTQKEKVVPKGLVDPHGVPTSGTPEPIKIILDPNQAPDDTKEAANKVTLDTTAEPKADGAGVIVDTTNKPYDANNVPLTPKEKSNFVPTPTINEKKKVKKESGIDSAKLKELEKNIRSLNERYLSATQREDKALLYSQLEKAQKEYENMQVEREKNAHNSEKDRKMARLEALREIIRDLNEKYLSETQREQKAILYSQLEQAQKEYRKLEEELDGNSKEKIAVEKTEDAKDDKKEDEKKEIEKTSEETKTTEKIPEKEIEFSAEDLLKLGEFRDEYLKAKRLRGNVFRGKFGGFFGRILNRKLPVGKEEMNFGGKNGALELERVRMDYQSKLSEYRSIELNNLQNELVEKSNKGELTHEDCNAQMKAKIIDLLSAEQGNIDRQSVEGIEKNVFEKMKTKWRQLGKTRLIAGGLLGGASILTAGTALGVGVVGARVVVGGIGTYVGAEAGMERYSKLVGHKGLINKINKDIGNSISPTAIDAYLAKIPAEEIKKEAARLRMLQVEKGVAIHNLNTPRGGDSLVGMIMKRDAELAAENAILSASPDETLNFANTLSEKLAGEINLRNEIVESEVDKERMKKMARKTLAALAGGSIGWIIGSKLLQNNDGLPPIGYPKLPGLPVMPPTPTSLIHTVTSGENTWKIIESNLDSHSTMTGLSEGARTHMIDALKDKFDGMTPAQLKLIGFSSGDADILSVGDPLNMTSVLNDPSIVGRALLESKSLSASNLAEIVKNNREIATWLTANKASLTGVFDSQTIERVLRGTI